VRLQDGTRLEVDVSEGPGRASVGHIALKDAAGRDLFASEALGVLQATTAWASLTGEGRLANGERRAFTLILDKAPAVQTQGRAVVLSIDSEPDRIASSGAAIDLGEETRR
jgi:hypothetical protein